MLLWLLLSYTKSLTLHTKPSKLEWVTDAIVTLFKDGDRVCHHSRSATVFKATSMQSSNEITITWCQAILNGVKLATRCNLFVIMWLVTEINWWKFQVCYCQHTQNCALSRNSHSLFTIWDSLRLCVGSQSLCRNDDYL